jgi:hypothetical protein
MTLPSEDMEILGHAQAGRLRFLHFIDVRRTDRPGIVGADRSLVDVRMIPTFAVAPWIIVHIISLLQLRRRIAS